MHTFSRLIASIILVFLKSLQRSRFQWMRYDTRRYKEISFYDHYG